MWNKELEELDPSVIKRVPVRDDDNEFYFPNDKFQAMPKYGYTMMFENLLNHININIYLNYKFHKDMENEYDYIFNSMPIDVYHDYKYGKLEYRSIKFTTIDLPIPFALPVTTVNFTHSGKHSRVTEWKHISNGGHNDEMTTLTYEEPCDYKDNNFERYYPVKDLEHKNLKRYVQYKDIETPKMKFIGRCGMYVYINMDEAVNHALACADEFLKLKGGE
jgi:UDP-galactopyranose mutase